MKEYKMTYKIMMMKAEYSDNYKKRVYAVNKEEFDVLRAYNTFVLRETIDNIKVYKSVESDKYYMIVE